MGVMVKAGVVKAWFLGCCKKMHNVGCWLGKEPPMSPRTHGPFLFRTMIDGAETSSDPAGQQ